jgi:DNA-binding MarR family transcriptional regulator
MSSAASPDCFAASMIAWPSARVLLATLRVLDEVRHDHVGERLGHVLGARDRFQMRRCVVDLLHEQTDGLVALERRAAREHLVEERRDRVDVARRPDRVSLRALGRDVARRSEDEARGGRDRLLAPVDARDAEVEHLHEIRIGAAPDEHDVLGLEIAMHDADGVGLTGRLAELQRDVERLREGECAACGREGALEREPLEVLHDHVERAIGELPSEEHLHDVRVLEARGHLRLAREARHELRVRAQLAVEDLDGDVAIDALLERAIDASHRADTDELADLDVPGDLLAEVRVVLGVAPCGGRALERHAVERAEQGVARIARAACTTHFR